FREVAWRVVHRDDVIAAGQIQRAADEQELKRPARRDLRDISVERERSAVEVGNVVDRPVRRRAENDVLRRDRRGKVDVVRRGGVDDGVGGVAEKRRVTGTAVHHAVLFVPSYQFAVVVSQLPEPSWTPGV